MGAKEVKREIFKSELNNIKDRCLKGSFEYRRKGLSEGMVHNSAHNCSIHTGL